MHTLSTIKNPSSIGKIFVKDLMLIIILLVVIEVAVRIVAPQNLNTLLRYVYEPANKYNGYQFIPGAQTVCNNGFGDHLFYINAWRCRDRDYGPKQSAEMRILCVGDSFSENQALPVEQIYPNILEAQLANKYPGRVFSVINAGMAGWDLWAFYDYIREMLPVIKADVVVLAVGVSSSAVASSERPVIPKIKILAGLPIRAEASAAQRLSWGIWFAGETLESYSHAYIAFRRITYYPSLWLKIGKVPLFHPMCLDQKQVDRYYEPTFSILKKIQTICSENGAQLTLLNVPYYYECIPRETWLKIQLENPDVSSLDVSRPARFLANIAKALSIPVYDPSDELGAASEPVYFPIFLHWNEHGNRIVANGLLRFLEEQHLL